MLMSFTYVFVLSLWASRELARLSSIAHPFETCAEDLPPIAQALKACADELPLIAQAGAHICGSCISYSSFQAKWASSCSSCSSPWTILRTLATLYSPCSEKSCTDELPSYRSCLENMCSKCISCSSCSSSASYSRKEVAPATVRCSVRGVKDSFVSRGTKAAEMVRSWNCFLLCGS